MNNINNSDVPDDSMIHESFISTEALRFLTNEEQNTIANLMTCEFSLLPAASKRVINDLRHKAAGLYLAYGLKAEQYKKPEYAHPDNIHLDATGRAAANKKVSEFFVETKPSEFVGTFSFNHIAPNPNPNFSVMLSKNSIVVNLDGKQTIIPTEVDASAIHYSQAQSFITAFLLDKLIGLMARTEELEKNALKVNPFKTF